MYRSSESIDNIIKSMIEAAKEIKSIPKTKSGFNGRYKYATLDSLIDMLREILPKYNLWFIQYPCDIESDIELVTRIIHSSGEWIETSMIMKVSDISGASAAQNIGGAITYFRRYILSCIFGVSCDDDSGSQSIEQPRKQPQQNKGDANQYLINIIEKRIKSGEVIESILQSFAEILGVDSVRNLESMTPEEKSKVANYIFNQEKKSMLR